jgi:AbrB family looped-hinge helix DNA binding protein
MLATVSHKGQVVIPATFRHMLGIKPGTALDFELDGNALRVSLRNEVTSASIEQGYGMLVAKKSYKNTRKTSRNLADFDVAQAMKAQK